MQSACSLKKTRKNILILSHSYAPQFIDICNQYVKMFDRSKYHVTVAYLAGPSEETARMRTESAEIIFLDFKKSVLRRLKIAAIIKLIGFCRQRNFSVVICHRYKPIYLFLWVNLFCKIPAIFCVMHAMGTLSSFFRRLLIGLLAGKNFCFVGVSNAVRDDLRHSLWGVPQERVITLYNCLDMSATERKLLERNAARKALGIAENQFVFGSIGRLEPVKDQHSLLAAFAAVRQQCPQSFLVIMGGGSLEQALRDEVGRLQLTDAVTLSGFVSEAFRYLLAYDVFVLTSTEEAFGRVLTEAMTAKLPLIGTRADGIPEVIGTSGLLVMPGDVAGIAAAMQQYAVMSSDERRCWGEKGYRRVREKFSLAAFHKAFWSVPLLDEIESKGGLD